MGTKYTSINKTTELSLHVKFKPHNDISYE